MRKIVGAFNITLDGFCDHTAVDPDEDVHDHYAQLLNNARAILYGRKTFELMKFWQNLLTSPSEDISMNEFAKSIDAIPKIVFSNTIQSTDWSTAVLSKLTLAESVKHLKQVNAEKDVLVGSRSLILQLLNLQLLDELQLCIHPVIAGGKLPLFEGMDRIIKLDLVQTKKMKSGAVILFYQPDYSFTS